MGPAFDLHIHTLSYTWPLPKSNLVRRKKGKLLKAWAPAELDLLRRHRTGNGEGRDRCRKGGQHQSYKGVSLLLARK